MNNKKAIIILQYDILDLYIQSKNQNEIDKYFQQLKEKLTDKKLIKDKIYNLSHSMENNVGNLVCNINITKLQDIQTLLMQNNFEITFII